MVLIARKQVKNVPTYGEMSSLGSIKPEAVNPV